MEIRPLSSDADFDACVALQQLIWGDDVRDMVPPALLKVCQRVGGIAAGAFDESERLAGFVFGVTGIAGGEPVHWSHMLAVQPNVRDRAVGRRLKLYQRAQLLSSGIKKVFWTFDPLVARNAHLNLNVLGTTIEEYVIDMYGSEPTSKTDTHIGSDRFVVRWDLEREIGGRHDPAPHRAELPIVTARLHTGEADVTEPPLPAAPIVLVEIPSDIQEVKLQSAEIAAAWRRTTRRALPHYLSQGYSVRGFVRQHESGRRFYVLRGPTHTRG